MKRLFSVLVALALVSPVLAQDETTGNGSGEQAAPMASTAGEWDLLNDLWFFEDAVPVETGTLDLRFSFGWETSNFPASAGDSDDDFIVTPSLYWGFAENWQLSATVPVWVGDGRNRGGYEDGNYDTFIGVHWRFMEQADGNPMDMALIGNFRIPTGNGSSGIDYEGRLALTHNYDNDMRSHFNAWGKITNGDNHDTASVNTNTNTTGAGFVFGGTTWNSERNWQYGGNVGLDFPLCADGTVRMVVDYLAQTSIQEGQNWWHIMETGWEWQIDDANRLGMSFFYNIDQSTDAPNAGATMTFAHALTY